VLEFGCADGQHVPELMARHRIGSYTGIDINEASIAAAQKRATDQDINFLNANLLDGDVLEGSFDVIFAHDVFPILDSSKKEEVLGILLRHLAPRGVIIINELNHLVFIGNAVGNAFRGNFWRTFYFLKCYVKWARAELLGRPHPVVEPYRFAGEAWYREVGVRLAVEVDWRKGEGLFLPDRNLTYFQRIADRLIPSQRDLIILRYPSNGR
jgi:SAM-dependent methyltransferase